MKNINKITNHGPFISNKIGRNRSQPLAIQGNRSLRQTTALLKYIDKNNKINEQPLAQSLSSPGNSTFFIMESLTENNPIGMNQIKTLPKDDLNMAEDIDQEFATLTLSGEEKNEFDLYIEEQMEDLNSPSQFKP